MARARILVALASLIALSGCYSPYYDRHGYYDRYGYYRPGYYDGYYGSGYSDNYRGYGPQYRDGGADQYGYRDYDRGNPYDQNQERAYNPRGYNGPQSNPDYSQ
jgi:hypothetical protein